METGPKNALTRPSELLARAVRYELLHWRRLAPIAAIYVFGGLALRLILESSLRFVAQNATSLSAVPIVALLAAVFVLAGAFLYVWGFAALLLGLKNKRFAWQAAYREALSYVPRYALVMLLISLVVMAGTLLAVLPGIYLAVRFSVVSYVLVFEDTSALEAFRRSFSYVRGRWWAVFWREVALGLAIGGVYIVAAVLFRAALVPHPLQDLLFAAMNTLVVPAASVYVLLMYKELRERIRHGKSSD